MDNSAGENNETVDWHDIGLFGCLVEALDPEDLSHVVREDQDGESVVDELFEAYCLAATPASELNARLALVAMESVAAPVIELHPAQTALAAQRHVGVQRVA